MVALPNAISPTIAAIDAHYERHQRAEQVQRLTARLLSNGCDRQGWYALRWAADPQRFSGAACRANLRRDEQRRDLIQHLADAGFIVETVNTKTFREIEILAADGHYRQKAHGTVSGVLQAPKALHFLYADIQPEAKFRQIVKHGLGVAAPDRMAALQVGMHGLSVRRAYYLLKNRNTDELHDERVNYDAALAGALVAKAERIVRAETAPPKISDDPEFFTCRFCAASKVCHAGDFALRNCRTCLHSETLPGGGWYCLRHDQELSIDDQRAGCPQHLFLPSLVPGEQVDADPKAETVTYKLPGGVEWTDGRATVERRAP